MLAVVNTYFVVVSLFLVFAEEMEILKYLYQRQLPKSPFVGCLLL